jgi:hypothetical protein
MTTRVSKVKSLVYSFTTYNRSDCFVKDYFRACHSKNFFFAKSAIL